MKIALGMITRRFITGKGLLSFIDNAKKYGHKIDCVIVAHSRQHNPEIEEKVREKAELYSINIENPEYLDAEMKKRGMSDADIQTLLKCPIDSATVGLVPYGHNRMTVVMEAMLRGADVLFFVDSDVTPGALEMNDGNLSLVESDFFGTHLKYLESGADVTTGEYSGYNILPPAAFDGMVDLLYGVKKSDVIDYWQKSGEHRCLAYKPRDAEPIPCKKILGGNLALKLSSFAKLPPFFSSHYTLDDELFLCRGEDTVLGFEMAAHGIKCMDIGIYPLHDTYGSYPAEPDLQNDKSVQERFFYACAGWVGRNPFFNHILGKDPKTTREFQREHLAKGLPELVKFTSNPRYSKILKCFDVSWDSLDRYVSEFMQTSEAWETFKEKIDLP